MCYLGHVVSEHGVETDPEKISALKSWPVPQTLKELRTFHGFAGYYRRFNNDYAAIAKPLNDRTKGYISTLKRSSKATITTKSHNVKQPFIKKGGLHSVNLFLTH